MHGTAPRSRSSVRAQSRVSCLPTAHRSREMGRLSLVTELPGSSHGTDTLRRRNAACKTGAEGGYGQGHNSMFTLRRWLR